MLRDRKRATLALTAVAASTFVALGPAQPSSAEPTIDDVKERVDKLYTQAEAAQERLHDAKLDLAEVNRALAGLKKDEKRQNVRVERVRSTVAESVVEQFRGAGISTVGQVVVSENPSDFLSQLTTMSEFNDLQNEQFSSYSTELAALDIRREETLEQQAEAAKLKKKLAKEKAEVDDKYGEAQALLDDLEAEAAAAAEPEVSRAGDTARLPSVPASGRASAAVAYAMAQVGDSYVYGAAGPSAFDCSGLTMMAWAQAGVGLPHSSSAQMGSGSPVSMSELQPGDLVFYYSPVSHVGMYIGNGQIVHAANPSTGVAIASVNSMPYSGAVRPG